MSIQNIDSSQESTKKKSYSTKGYVYWITGLAGAGKTTIAKILYGKIKKINPQLVFLDGDRLRDVLGTSSSYSVKERLAQSMRYAKLCHLLAVQGISVICSTISMFEACRKWNRDNNSNYFEIYIRVSMDQLKKRDQKKLYSKARFKKISDVVGIDISFEEPKKADLIIENEGEKTPEHICNFILTRLPL